MTKESRTIVVKGSSDNSKLLSHLSLAEKERVEENKEKVIKRYYRQQKALKEGKEVAPSKRIKIEDLPTSQQILEAAYGEYVAKPYSPGTLLSYMELNQKLAACVYTTAKNSVGLGVEISPFNCPHVVLADMSDDDLEKYKEQKSLLLSWLNTVVGRGTSFVNVMLQVGLMIKGLGEAYLEIIEDAKGNIHQIKFANPTKIVIGKNRDRYIQIYQGVKTYFRPFWEDDPQPRFASDFSTSNQPIPLNLQATKLIHFKEFSLKSDTYGVPCWIQTAPAILGSRAAEERNKAFFDNDAVPRMAILISGGSLTDSTVDEVKQFFEQGHKGVDNSNRLLILEVSAQNTNSPDWKPPKIELKPLTIGKSDDASFLDYLAYNNKSIRESFGISEIFLGTSADVNRAAAFTMREMTVNLVFKTFGMYISSILNNTILEGWKKEFGLSEDECKVQIGFKLPLTISQKDLAAIKKAYASAGGLTPNDLRADLGLDLFDEPWGNIPTPLLIVFAQMSLIDTPTIDEETMGETMGVDATGKGSLSLAIRQIKTALEKYYGKGDVKDLLKNYREKLEHSDSMDIISEEEEF